MFVIPNNEQPIQRLQASRQGQPFIGPMPSSAGPAIGGYQSTGGGYAPMGQMGSQWGAPRVDARGAGRNGLIDRSQMQSAYYGPMGIGGFQRGQQGGMMPGMMRGMMPGMNGPQHRPMRGMGPMGIEMGPRPRSPWSSAYAGSGQAPMAQPQQEPPQQMFNRPAPLNPAEQTGFAG